MNQSRIKRILAGMEQAGLSQLIVSDPDSLYYLTGIGYDPGERMLALYLNDQGDAHLFNNHMFPVEQQEGLTIHLYDDTDDYVALLAAVTGPGSIGVDKAWPAKFLLPLLQQRPALQAALGSPVVDQARMCKDAVEQQLLRQASAVNDATMAEVIQRIGEGMTEREMLAAVGNTHVRHGADAATDQLICFGVTCSEPHHVSGNNRLQPGEGAIFDIFTPVRRYWCDMTRTVFWGRVSPRQRQIYDIVHAANQAGIDAVRPGMPLRDIDRAARKVIEDAGFGPYFTHRLGHGCGLSVHEPPDCSSASQAIAQPGMCFSIEPGIYLPGEMGVRIEDLVLVTETGVEVLNHFSKDLTVIPE